MNLETLRAKNKERQALWCRDSEPDLAFRGLELGGEAGEAQNIIKKLERERHGWKGSRAKLSQLAEELADVVIVADLIAAQTGIDLSQAIRDKFNHTSHAVGINVFIEKDEP